MCSSVSMNRKFVECKRSVSKLYNERKASLSCTYSELKWNVVELLDERE